jgi:phosphatidylglycerophosphate synthase
VPRWWLNAIPNGLSASRIVFGLAFPFVPEELRLGLVIAAALSDLLDGWAARVLGAISDTGRLLDPVADKVFILMLAGTLLVEGTLHPLWAVGLAVRDITVLIGLIYLIARRQWKRGRRLKPSLLGKATTAAQFAVLTVLVVWQFAPGWLLAMMTALSVVAAIEYTHVFLKLTNDPSPTPGESTAGAV